jgi:hypothetical protein
MSTVPQLKRMMEMSRWLSRDAKGCIAILTIEVLRIERNYGNVGLV